MKTHAGRFGLHTATAVVVANMVGTGVFTSLGFQLEVLSSPFALLMLWVVGGVTAVCGALTYAEIGSRVRRSGGEYAFLERSITRRQGSSPGGFQLRSGSRHPLRWLPSLSPPTSPVCFQGFQQHGSPWASSSF